MNPTARPRGIGGTDISAVVSMNKYRSPFDLYCELMGLLERPSTSAGAHIGTLLEPVVGRLFTERTGLTYIPNDTVVVHPVHSYLFGTPDGYIEYEDGTRELLEIKTAGLRMSHYWGTEGTDEIPPEYLLQVQWYMGLTGCSGTRVALLLGGQEFKVYFVKFNPELYDLLVMNATDFWATHILQSSPPPITGSEIADNYLKFVYSKERAENRRATEEEEAWMLRLERIRADKKEIEDAQWLIENRLKQSMGDAAGIFCDIGSITWTANKAGSRVFRPKFYTYD